MGELKRFNYKQLYIFIAVLSSGFQVKFETTASTL